MAKRIEQVGRIAWIESSFSALFVASLFGAVAACGGSPSGDGDGTTPGTDSGNDRADDGTDAPAPNDSSTDTGATTDTPSSASKRTVYAWFPSNMSDWSTKAIDWTALTHISYRSVVTHADGTIDEPPASLAAEAKKLTDEAHAHGVKVTVLAWGTTEADSSQYLASHADELVSSLLSYVKAHDLDGIDIDDETWGATNSATGGPNAPLVTAFFQKLHDAFKGARSDYHLSWASPPVIAASDKFGASWVDYAAVAKSLDVFATMSYTMNPPSIGWTTGAQPVGGGGLVGSHPRDYSTMIHDYVAATGGAKNKILLGIGTDRGGVEWDAATDGALARTLSGPRTLDPATALANATTHGRKLDPLQKEPFYSYPSGAGFVQGWYEDDESFAAKYTLVRDEGIAGICMWVIDGSSEPASTWKTIHDVLDAP